jgi:hypothetical protein
MQIKSVPLCKPYRPGTPFDVVNVLCERIRNNTKAVGTVMPSTKEMLKQHFSKMSMLVFWAVML